MIQLIDEFGSRVWIPVQVIKYFKDNMGPYAQQHKAKSVIESLYGDLFYVRETCDEICERLFSKPEEQAE